MAKPGKRAPINLVEVEKLAALHVTDQEMAGWFEVNVRTIERRKKNRKFAAAIERGRAKGKISIRRMQMQMLQAGNSTMGVWLGKQILGQNEYAPPPESSITSVILLPFCAGVEPPGEASLRLAGDDIEPAAMGAITGGTGPTIDVLQQPTGEPTWRMRSGQ